MKQENSRTGTLDSGPLTNQRPWLPKEIELVYRFNRMNICATKGGCKNEGAVKAASTSFFI